MYVRICRYIKSSQGRASIVKIEKFVLFHFKPLLTPSFLLLWLIPQCAELHSIPPFHDLHLTVYIIYLCNVLKNIHTCTYLLAFSGNTGRTVILALVIFRIWCASLKYIPLPFLLESVTYSYETCAKKYHMYIIKYKSVGKFLSPVDLGPVLTTHKRPQTSKCSITGTPKNILFHPRE